MCSYLCAKTYFVLRLWRCLLPSGWMDAFLHKNVLSGQKIELFHHKDSQRWQPKKYTSVRADIAHLATFYKSPSKTKQNGILPPSGFQGQLGKRLSMLLSLDVGISSKLGHSASLVVHHPKYYYATDSCLSPNSFLMFFPFIIFPSFFTVLFELLDSVGPSLSIQ
jgi:hypothetical protein